jgi:twitching motility protein PilT
MTEVRIDAIDPYLSELWDRKGSDILLTAGVPPLLRVDGAMRPVDGAAVLDPADLERIVLSVLPPEVAERFREEKDADFSFSWRDLARFRGNVFIQRGAMAMALRLIPFQIPSFEELGLPQVIERFVRQPRGLVLATGPTGAGKSTTLASMIDRINHERSCHIVTVEDPIEYVHHHASSAVNQREVGQDANSFARALRSALRADPDVLLVGEMRDLETIQTVLTMAETGHLVFGTLHTNDAAQAIDRIVDVFPSERQQQIRVQLANTLTGVICQQLLPRIGGGRVAAFEILVANHAVRNLVKEGKTNQLRNVQLTGHEEGMSTLEASLSDLVTRGVVTHEDALARSLFPKEVAKPRPVPPAMSVPEEIVADA